MAKKAAESKKVIKKEPKTKSKKVIREVSKARIYIQSTFNNTIVTFTDIQGNTLCWGSTGMVGFSGTRKHTPFAASTAAEAAIKKAQSLGVRELEVYVKGPGSGRDAVLRTLKAKGFRMSMIADVTPIPHNGPRPRKRRRV